MILENSFVHSYYRFVLLLGGEAKKEAYHFDSPWKLPEDTGMCNSLCLWQTFHSTVAGIEPEKKIVPKCVLLFLFLYALTNM